MIVNQTLQEIMQLNFLPVMVIVFLFIFIRINDPYEHNITLLFSNTLVILLLLIVSDNLDYVCYNNEALPKELHVVAAVFGYNLRIGCLVSLIHIVHRYDQTSRKQVCIMCAPMVLNFLVTLTPFFSHLMFWYDEDNVMRRGPLSLVPHYVCLLYSIALIYYAIRLLKRHSRRDEGIIIITSVAFMLLATAVEMIFRLRGVLMGMIAIATTFYYLYVHIAYFRQDVLTGTLNRASFHADIKKYGDSYITALISIDLNDLKMINDSQGHDAGDRALIEVVSVINAHLLPKCELYRVGGDEFFVICINTEETQVRQMVDCIDDAMKQSRYTWACGVGIWQQGMTFSEVYKDADKKMYRKKTEMKKIQAHLT